MQYNDSCSTAKNICLEIFKFDGRTGEGLANAVFELISDCGCVSSVITNESGCGKLKLAPCSTYTLREAIPPSGFVSNPHVFEICADTCGCVFVDGVQTTCLKICDSPITGTFTAIKVNIEDGEPLEGALYTLYLGGVPISAAYSTEDGEITFSCLLPGEYTLSETQPPEGFQSNPGDLPVSVAADGTVTILGEQADGYILNDVPLSAFIFTKVDAATMLPLAGATFELSQNGMPVANAVSDSQGIVDFGVLAAGDYELTETVTPPGFLPNTTVYQVSVDTDGSMTVNGVSLDYFRVEDVEFPGFSFIKSDIDTGAPLAGAVFELRQNGTVIDTSISDMTGFVSFSALAPGTYQLIESEPPSGYVANPTIYTVIVTGGGTVTIDGQPAENFSVEDAAVSFTVLKTDLLSNPLADAVYNLQQYGMIVMTETSGIDGLMTFTGVTPGVYTLVEAEAPDGFALNTTVHEVEITREGEVIIDGVPTTTLTVENSPLPPGPQVLGWMRSTETVGYVPGARIPVDAPPGDIFNGWDFSWVRSHTLMQYFENDEILDAALAGEYTCEALGLCGETLFNTSELVVDETFVWDGGTTNQFFKGYSDAPVTGGWASWANVNVPSSLMSPQTQEPVPGGYTPYHYSLRRFTTYLDVDFSQYNVESAFLISAFPSGTENEFVFPLNDSIFVFVNGTLAYWASTDLIGSGNVSQIRKYFDGVEGMFLNNNPAYVFTDGWYLTLGGAARIANIAPLLRDGKNVIDVIADDYYFGGGMSRINTDFVITPA